MLSVIMPSAIATLKSTDTLQAPSKKQTSKFNKRMSQKHRHAIDWQVGIQDTTYKLFEINVLLCLLNSKSDHDILGELIILNAP